MLFNSYIFILLFLPLTLAGWYLLNHFQYQKAAQGYLIGMSLWFYAYFNVSFLWILLGSCIFNYGLSFLFDQFEIKYCNTESFHWKENPSDKRMIRWLKCLLLAGLLGNTGALSIFKYTNFIIDNINTVFSADFNLVNIILPLGISFITFQQLSFLIDRYRCTRVCLENRNESEQIPKIPHVNILDYLSFVTFFPSLVSGPIVLHAETIGQFQDKSRRTWNPDQFTRGMLLFSLGLGKKVLLADTLALGVNYGFANITSLDSISALLTALLYTLELYFDFSGYSDMAVGIGWMFGIDLPQNFNAPYKAVTVKDFWKRWHISLSTFLQNYVYFSLGGNRKGKYRTHLNTMITFLISGIWHGANWTFVFWGFLHGIGVVASNLFPIDRNTKTQTENKKTISKRGMQTITFLYICTAFIFFRADNINDGFALIKRIFSFETNGTLTAIAAAMEPTEPYILTKALSMFAPQLIPIVQVTILSLYLIVCFLLIRGKRAYDIVQKEKISKPITVIAAIILAWSILYLSGVTSFVYFNF